MRIGARSGAVLSALVDAVEDEDAGVRTRAVLALGMLRMATPPVTAALTNALVDLRPRSPGGGRGGPGDDGPARSTWGSSRTAGDIENDDSRPRRGRFALLRFRAAFAAAFRLARSRRLLGLGRQPPGGDLLPVLDQDQGRDLAGRILDEPGLGSAARM